jgi:hypothetical protein
MKKEDIYRLERFTQLFWSKVDKSGGPDACWPWMCHTFRGYGNWTWTCADRKKRTFQTHRIAYLLTHGTVSDDKQVCHACDNRPCCNPAHLSEGTRKENMEQMVARNRAARGLQNGRHTHPDHTARGERHGRTHLTAEQVREIRQQYASGTCTQRSLALRYRVNDTTIGSIVRWEVWRHV